jgi:hypothetical protein
MKTVAEQSMSSQTPLGWISYGVYQEILTENLNMRRIAAKFVPRLLTNDQKQRRVNVCLELREKPNEDQTFISRIITGDEIGIYGYDPEKKQQSSLWKSPQSPKCNNRRCERAPSQKKRGRSGVQQRACSLFFST